MSQWMGCAVLHCELWPRKKSGVYCEVKLGSHGLDAAPFSTSVSYGNGAYFSTESDWLREGHLGDYDAVESVEVDEGDSRAVSFDKPHVLVRIRGKRKSGDRLTEVEGPAPGFMLWLQKKE